MSLRSSIRFVEKHHKKSSLVVQQNDDFNLWRRKFEECMADCLMKDHHTSLRSASSFIR